METPSLFYDSFSSDYDHFVNWAGRLDLELPFLDKQLIASGAKRVLDAACGTGMHTIALAKLGFEAAGADVSVKMVEKAELNAKAAGVSVAFKAAGFGELNAAFGSHSFDAVFCLGNSLPHLLTAEDMQNALADFAAVLKPAGLLIIQNRNFDSVMKTRQRWMEPQFARAGDDDWLFLRFYDFVPDGLINFNMLTLKRRGNQNWQQSILSTPLRPILSDEFQPMLRAAGFQSLELYGDLTGSPFLAETSGNLVIKANKYV